jgi:hypothetical protein
VTRLIDDLFALGWDGTLAQIKEKFGGLRFYIGGGSDVVHQRINEAENESYKVCEKCGEPGKHSSWGGYWITTLCPRHGEERREKVASRLNP